MATSGCLVAVLVPLGSMLEDILLQPGAYRAILEASLGYLKPSWSHRGPSWTLLLPAVPPLKLLTPGEGPEGKERAGRDDRLNHRRPKGWWDS